MDTLTKRTLVEVNGTVEEQTPLFPMADEDRATLVGIKKDVEAIKEGQEEMKRKLDKDYVLVKVYELQIEALTSDMDDLKSDRKWIIRLIVGAIVLGILAFLGIGK